MAEVTIDLCGYATTVACADGEEAQLQRLVAIAQDRADKAAGIVGQDRLRQLIFAAIFLADEVSSKAASGRAAPARARESAAPEDSSVGAIADRLSAATARIDALTQRIDALLAD